MNIKRILLGAAAALLLMTGCTDKENIKEIPIEVSSDIELRVVTMFGGTDPSRRTFESQLRTFEENNPGVNIINDSYTSIGDEFRIVVKSDFATGNEADILFFYNGVDVAGIINMNGVMPYSQIMDKYPDVGKDISHEVLELVREADGEIYALPLTGFYEGLYVNKDIFDAYSLELPTDWEKFMTAISVLSENGITPIAAPLAQSHYLVEHFIYGRAGTEAYEDTLEEGVPSSWAEGILDIKELNEVGAFPKDPLAIEIESAQNMFMQEKAAMIFEGSWFIGRCSEELTAKMTVLPMPTPPGGAKGASDIIAGFSAGYYVSRKAYEDEKKQAVVIDLIRHLTSKEAIKAIATANGGIPAADVQVEGLPGVAIEGQTMFFNAGERAMPLDSRLKPEAFNHIISDGIPYVVFGEKEPMEMLLEVKEINDN